MSGIDREQQIDTNKEIRDYAWKYFSLHAEQRIKVFQFFITLETAIIGGSIALSRFGGAQKWISLFGLMMAFLSFVFWKLDVRTRALVKNGESALKYLDSLQKWPPKDGVPHPLSLVERDDHNASGLAKFPLTNGHFSYSRCFNWLFVFFTLVGLLGAVAGLVFLPNSPANSNNCIPSPPFFASLTPMLPPPSPPPPAPPACRRSASAARRRPARRR